MLNPLTFLNPYMFWVKLAGIVVVLAGVGFATHYVDANVYGKQISDLKLAQEKQKSADIGASLTQLTSFIAKMNAAGDGYNDELAHIDSQFAALKKGLSNALLHPLPADCKPDADRVRSLHDALDAANHPHPAAAQ